MGETPQFRLDRELIEAEDDRAILIVPYMWIGDFVRGHSAVRLLRERWPNRPIDMLAASLPAPLADYMPGVRKTIVSDLPRGRVAPLRRAALAKRLRAENYGAALIFPATWKSALAPALAGIPQRIGFSGEARFGLVNDLRGREDALPRMVDRMACLALPRHIQQSAAWPPPRLEAPQAELEAWRAAHAIGPGPAVALAPGATAPSRRWPGYAETAKRLLAAGLDVWIVGGPGETGLGREIAAAAGPRVRDFTGGTLRDGIRALASARAVIANDSGLLHVAAALGAPTVGIFGPSDPWLWSPVDGLAATIRREAALPCQPCHQTLCTSHDHRCMTELSPAEVAAATERVVAGLSISGRERKS